MNNGYGNLELVEAQDQNVMYLVLQQYMYKLGVPITSDKEYDRYVKQLEEMGYTNLDLRWDTIPDEVGQQLITVYGMDDLLGTTKKETVFSDSSYLIEEPANPVDIEEYRKYKLEGNRSMPILTEPEDLIQVLKHFQGEEITEVLASLKIDGWNVSLFIKNGSIVYAHSRGRQAEEQDITTIMKAVLAHIDGQIPITKGYVVGEFYLDKESLPILREKYNKEFKTTRNSISTFISNNITREDMPLAKFGAFRMKCLDKEFLTHKEMFDYLVECGFDTPNYDVVTMHPQDITELVIEWGENINHLAPSDGITFQPNIIEDKSELSQVSGISESYEIGIYAIKMGAWGEQVLRTTIEEITYTYNTKSIRPSLLVAPVKTREGREITIVPVDHIGRMIDEDLYVGKEIYLTVVSEKDIRLLYDRELAQFRV